MKLLNIFKKKPKTYIVTKDKITVIKESLQGLEEGQIQDILSTYATQVGTLGTVHINKNNYQTYPKQVQAINRMYNNETDYGGELTGTLVDTSVSFIGGSGVSVKAEKKTRNFVVKLLKDNKLEEGSELLDNIKTGVMEGKDLLKLSVKDGKVKIRNFSNYVTPYHITASLGDAKVYEKAVVTVRKKSNESKAKTITLSKDKFVYVKLGGSPDRLNITPPKIGRILTDIENFSRAKYDMRENNHLFGRVTQIFLVTELKEAKSLQLKINSMDSVIGKAYAGTAKQVYYLEPSGQGQKVLQDEMRDLLRIIATNIGMPIQLLNYPELLSNRATAENMLEMVNAATVQPRLIWEEALTECVQKAMVLSTEHGLEGAVNDQDGFELKLALISYANLKQIQETWLPLADAEYVSRKTVMSLLPGINPSQEERFLKKEKEERMTNMPTIFQNGQDENKEDEKEKTKEKINE